MLALILVWLGTYRIDLTSRFDRGVQTGFIGLDDTRLGDWAELIVDLVDRRPFGVMSLILIAVAVSRRRLRLALMTATILVGANVTTQVLQRLSEGPRAYEVATTSGVIGAELWPSGHTTGAMTLALCLVLVLPRRLQPLGATVGGCFAVAVVYSLMVLAHHLPSDSVGAFFVATSWTFAVLTVCRLVDRRWPGPARLDPPLRPATVLWPLLTVAAISAIVVIGVAAGRPDQALSHVVAHTAFTLGAPLLGALGLLLASGVALVLRR